MECCTACGKAISPWSLDIATRTCRACRSAQHTGLAKHFAGGGWSWFVLTVAQLLLAASWLLIPVSVVQQLGVLDEAEIALQQAKPTNPSPGWNPGPAIARSRTAVVVFGACLLCLSVALFVVLKRAKAAVVVAAHQDGENRRLWQAIRELDDNRREELRDPGAVQPAERRK